MQKNKIHIKSRIIQATRILFALILLIACESGEHLFNGDLIPAVFVPSIAGEVEGDVTTRVVGKTWSGSEVVGISQVTPGGSLATNDMWYQYKATANNPATSATLTPTATNQIVYYPVDGGNVNFFAFSPYKAPTSANLVTYSATDQSTLANLEVVDFIWAKATGTHNKKSPNVNLAFEHKQSKVIVKVTADTSNGVTATDMSTSNAALTLTSMPCGAWFKLADGALNGISHEGTITPYKNTTLTTTTSVTWEAIVPPHAGTSYTSRKLNFTFNGKSYSYTMPTSDIYVAGYSYTYDFTLTTSGVVLQSSTVSNWTGGTTSWNGGTYVLQTTSSELNFHPAASSQTLQIQYQGTTTAPVAVTSTSATSSTEGALDWLTVSVATNATTNSPWTQRTLTVTATTANTEITNRTGYIHISLEGLSVVIKVTQGGVVDQGDANCFIVAPGSTFSFDLSRAITYGGAASNSTFTVTKLWDDTSGGAVTSVSVSDKTITVVAGNIPGNALIAAQVGGVTVWSWHIWVTGYNPNVSNFVNTYNKNKNGDHFVFMDRNLGAMFAGTGAGYGTGLFYQWGRKDPFPATLNAGETQPGGGTFTTVITNVTNGTVANTIKNPNIFYYAIVYPYDWLYAARDNTLWGHGNTTPKSPYDPCPAGWRIPSHNVAATTYTTTATSPWYGFSEGEGTTPANIIGSWSNGYNWGTSAAYPATGYRYGTSSNLNKVGSEGFIWGGSPGSGVNGSNLYFVSTGIIVSANNTNRSNGYSVRCVQE